LPSYEGSNERQRKEETWQGEISKRKERKKGRGRKRERERKRERISIDLNVHDRRGEEGSG
jgi:hypothetical protein